MTRTAAEKLTRKERAEMWLAQGGLCGCGCQKKLVRGETIDEHTVPNFFISRKPDAIYRLGCANVKTNGTKATTYGSDRHEIAKAKRLSPDHKEMTQADRRKAGKTKPIPNRGFPSKEYRQRIKEKYGART